MNANHPFAKIDVMGLRLVAVVETVLILAALLVLSLITGSPNRFFDVDPHPFWIAVLLVSAQYGALEGVLAAVLASAALLIGNLPPLGYGEDPYNYAVNLSINPAMWLAAALGIGELRSQADRRNSGLVETIAEAREREDKLIAAAERLALANRALEERVAGQLRTVASLYEASRAVEQLGTGDVLVGISELVRAGLNPRQFSLYLLNEQRLESVLCEGWPATSRFTRVFGSASPVYREVIVNQRFLCVANPADQITLGGEGILAGPICSAESGETLGMLKIERMDAVEFNMTAVESFRVICQWIGTAFSRARTFEQASARSFVGTGGILSASAEKPLTQFLKSLAARLGFELCAISVQIKIPDNLSPNLKGTLYRTIRHTLATSIRQTDIACECSAHGFDYMILAPGCAPIEARRLTEKIKAALTATIPADTGVRILANASALIERPVGARA